MHSWQLYNLSLQVHSSVNDMSTWLLALFYISLSALQQSSCSLTLHSWWIFLSNHVCRSHLFRKISSLSSRLLLSDLFFLLILRSHFLSRQRSVSLRFINNSMKNLSSLWASEQSHLKHNTLKMHQLATRRNMCYKLAASNIDQLQVSY